MTYGGLYCRIESVRKLAEMITMQVDIAFELLIRGKTREAG